jgi:BRCA1/BRCA2-containing complex subunit 3
MQLARVDVTQDAYLCMLSHALSTEHEEVMGLLCGDTSYGPDAELLCTVWSTAPQSRSDRRRDRVETTPEQLAATSQAAARASAATGVTTRVIGWYHSHPHITVLPSAVGARKRAAQAPAQAPAQRRHTESLAS